MRHRRPLVVTAVLAATLLAGCGGDDESPPAATASPAGPTTTAGATAGATASQAVMVWAGGVCTEATDFRGAVNDLSVSIPFERSEADTVREQVRSGVQAKADAVRDAAASLGAAVRALPDDADPAVVAEQEDLAAAASQAQLTVDAVRAAVAQVADAATPQVAAAALPALRAAASAARSAVDTYAVELQDARDSADAAVRQAFGTTAECQEAVATATP
jgi:hypothetical protein